jgi:hypothetical protein
MQFVASVWSVADHIERRGHFADEQIRGGSSIPPPPVVDLANLRVSFPGFSGHPVAAAIARRV